MSFNKKEQYFIFENFTPKELSEAGFYYLGPKDKIVCFSCKQILSKTTKDISLHNAWIVHAGLYPHCNFINENKPPEFIENAKL
jgi:methionyl-tRNA formyltransferase